MDSVYNHQKYEEKIYKLWEKIAAFTPNENPQTKPFTIIMPPPNANDPLHIGHAMFVTIEDILIRYHRLLGEAALWLPGTDHAGIETQFVFEKKLKKEGKSRFDYDRQTLYQMIWDYVQNNSGVAVTQMKKLGASADWSRFKFTLDANIVKLVIETFKLLHRQKLVYRELQLVNYCTRCGTSFSELEIKHVIRKDPFYYIKYGPFVIGTVRPETKFRDRALAVNPLDKRYQKLVGKTLNIPGLLGPMQMTVISDPEVDPKFGTGMMKVTPAHDFHDFELGKKHELPVTPLINFNGKMDFGWFLQQPNIPQFYKLRAKTYHGLSVSKIRPLIVQHLNDDGLLVKTDNSYEHTVSTCYRCGSIIEPLPLTQFFIKVSHLTIKVLKAIKEKQVKIYGSGYDKILKHWLVNLKDWNISRQIVWGIRLPVWYDINKCPDIHLTIINKTGELVSGRASELRKKYTLSEIRNALQNIKADKHTDYVVSETIPGINYIQETDTFDTWFSSAQWPFATLLNSSKSTVNIKTQTSDYHRFYPTQVMETAYDILIFWVMRMLMLGIHITGKVPFEKVYLHGLVRDEKGQKMSKSKGNVINPSEIISKFGADALRMALVMSTAAGKDSATGEGKIRGMRNFTNKIWNAARYILMNRLTLATSTIRPIPKSLNQNNATVLNTQKLNYDAEFTKRLNQVVKTVTKQLDDLKIGLAAETIYNEFWHWFCDDCIEKNKTGELSNSTLYTGLKIFLRLLHPFVPFVTESIWQMLPDCSTCLIVSTWPKSAQQ